MASIADAPLTPSSLSHPSPSPATSPHHSFTPCLDLPPLPPKTLPLPSPAPSYFRTSPNLACASSSSSYPAQRHLCSQPSGWLSIPGIRSNPSKNPPRTWSCSPIPSLSPPPPKNTSSSLSTHSSATGMTPLSSIRNPLQALWTVLLLVAMTHPQATFVDAAVTPAWRAFHGAAIVDTSMIIFGGVTDPTVSPYSSTLPGSSDLLVWSTTQREWSQPTIQFPGSTAGAPAPQKFLTSIALQSKGKMMSIVGNTSSPSTSLLMLDSYFWVWSIPNSPNSASAPALRLGAAVGTSDTLVFLHGGAGVANGYATAVVNNDLTKLDASTFQWTSIANGPTLMYHTMCKLTGLNMMVIFGGADQNTGAYNNVHTFDLTIEVWRLNAPVNAGVGGSIPSVRKGHTAVCLNNTMVMYGGGPDAPVDDDVWVLDASQTQWVWNRMTTNKQFGPGARTGHSALLNGTNMLVWGGYGSAQPNDTTVYILDTTTWQWAAPKAADPTLAIPAPPGPSNEVVDKTNNMPLTVGVICACFALIFTIVGFLVLRKRTSKRKKTLSQGTSSFLTDNEQQLSRDLVVEDKPSIHSSSGKDSGSSSAGRRSPNPAIRRSLSPHGYPMQSMAAFAAAEQGSSSRGESSRSSGQQPNVTGPKEKGFPSTTGSVGAKVGSISSDPFYPAYLAEDDEEDADRWTFASSLSFDHRENNHSMPTLRYIPTRVHGAPSTQRSLGHSTGSIGGGSSQRVPMMMHQPGGGGGRSSRRDASGISVRTGNGSSLGPGSISFSAAPTNSDALSRDGSTSPREGTLFNSFSPLDRVALACSGLDVGRPNENDALVVNYRSGGSIQLQQGGANKEPQGIVQEKGMVDLRRKDTTSTSTTKSSTTYTTLDNPALIALVQNLPARYKLLKSPCPIHGETNDILFAIDSDTQQPIVIKSFARKEAWERECRMLRRLRGPYIVELKHVATLVLSETDDRSRPAKIRLTILERLDETLAQMLKNARKAKKVALREQARSNEVMDLTGVGLYQSGTALDGGYIKDIVKGVLRCLSWCHSKRIVYCDLKPSNVMHNRDDPRQQWKLIDMESSRAASEECIGIGTVRYCPPEVARGTTVDKQASDGVTANFSIDLWAFGCLIYELFATRPLFPLSLSDDTVLHFLAHPSADTPALANGLRWSSSRELAIPHFEQAVPDANARDLIRILLHPDPQRRANINHVLASEYLCISPESVASYTRTSTSSDGHRSVTSGSRSPPPTISTSQFQQPPWTIESVLRKFPCLFIPLPNLDEESSSWLDLTKWNVSSFKLHYLCQHDTQDAGSGDSSTLGHYVQQPGYPIQNPSTLFRELAPLLLKSLDMQLSRSPQCLPGFESLRVFEYYPDKDHATLDQQDPSAADSNAEKPGIVKGCMGYMQWMKRRIQRASGGASSPVSSSSADKPGEIERSLQALRVYSDAVKGPNSSSHGVPAGLQLISRGTQENQESILICDGHINLPQYSQWTSRT